MPSLRACPRSTVYLARSSCIYTPFAMICNYRFILIHVTRTGSPSVSIKTGLNGETKKMMNDYGLATRVQVSAVKSGLASVAMH